MTRRSLCLLLVCSVVLILSQNCRSYAFCFPSCGLGRTTSTLMNAAKAGSFFNEVPPAEDDDNKHQDELRDILDQHRQPSRASQPSTINGVPSSEAGMGFGKKQTPPKLERKLNNSNSASGGRYVGIGQQQQQQARKLNDVTQPQYDDQGYTLYADEETGQQSRVFEALIDYPCDFTLKIVGANEGGFVQDMLHIVANICGVKEAHKIPHSIKVNGKWTSVTVEAPVQSAEQLYAVYEKLDLDPRVKFKF